MNAANPLRDEAVLTLAGQTLALRPSFAALVKAEAEIGSLFALIDRASAGDLRIGELVTLFWHCLAPRPAGLTRDAFGEAVAAGGLAQATPAFRALATSILTGRG